MYCYDIVQQTIAYTDYSAQSSVEYRQLLFSKKNKYQSSDGAVIEQTEQQTDTGQSRVCALVCDWMWIVFRSVCGECALED